MKYLHIYSRLIIITMMLVVSSCAINPATGIPDLVFMSESDEIEKGKELHAKLIKSIPIYHDKKLNAYINKIGQKVVENSHRPNIEYHFTIIDAPDINAFALPGGYIYINRGLLTFLHSEAQLAAVLAHEVAHITARHVVKQDTARTSASTLTFLSVFTTGSLALGDATSLWSTAAVKGYGREMELQADGLAAEYLFNSGYAPQAMVEAIGVLKDQEKFSRYRAKEEGKRAKSYHGVFSTHPRNDIRLKEVVAKAGQFIDKKEDSDNKETYREHLEGMVYGINYEAMNKPKPIEKERYIHRKLGFSLLFPEKWQVTHSRKAIVGQPKNDTARLNLTIAINKGRLNPGNYLRSVTNVDLLLRSEDFSQYGMIGHTGIIKGINGKEDQRVAVIFQGSKAYLLVGEVFLPEKGVDYDTLFLKSIQSFRPERTPAKAKKSRTIHYVKANDNTRMDLLAKQMNLGVYSEQVLRLINGLYPRGEPKTGDWIKIIK
ncbi:MAG: M48 family metalloprotease [Colwellia sp.]|nr:M48 family metalloprotease [Colwellia sp.]